LKPEVRRRFFSHSLQATVKNRSGSFASKENEGFVLYSKPSDSFGGSLEAFLFLRRDSLSRPT